MADRIGVIDKGEVPVLLRITEMGDSIHKTRVVPAQAGSRETLFRPAHQPTGSSSAHRP